MKIAVCMKQVPAYSDGNMDEKTGLLIRSGLEAVVNVYDLAALETALKIREQVEARVDVFTMGPERARQVLRDAFAMGADRGYCISDRTFGGADVLATSYTLMQAIDSVDSYDLILCGRQTTDGDTAQVSGALAAWMDIPHFTAVTKLVAVEEGSITFCQSLEEKHLTFQVEYPCLLAVERSIFTPRMPTLKLKMSSRRKEIGWIGREQLRDQDPSHYGLKGSATRVAGIFPPERTARQECVHLDGKAAASYIRQTVEGIINPGEGSI